MSGTIQEAAMSGTIQEAEQELQKKNWANALKLYDAVLDTQPSDETRNAIASNRMKCLQEVGRKS